MQRVTFSRNFTLSLSRTCQCYCKYCAFATHQAHVHAPVDVEKILDEALKRNTKELLVLTGEKPEVNPVVAERLKAWGHEDFTSYVVWACEKALERGMLPHTNLGVLSKEDLGRLREVTASQGLMLESVDELVDGDGPRREPRPSTRMPASARIRAAGELKIPFTTGILVGIGESLELARRIPGSHRGASPRVRPHPGGHPPELRPAPALLRRRGGGDRQRGLPRALVGRRG